MKILLIYVVTENINIPVLPLGMACVAEAARHAGHEVRQVSLSPGKEEPLLEDEIAGFKPDVIGISVRNIDDQKRDNTTFLLEPVKDIVKRCKEITEVPVVLGGAGFSIFPESSLNFLGADMGIAGEGELAFLMLLDQLKEKGTLANIPGLYLPGEEVPEKGDLSSGKIDHALPSPETYLELISSFKDQDIWIPFQTRRGCSLKCNYCSTESIEGAQIRTYPVEKVVDVLQQFQQDGFSRFFFVDNIFNMPYQYALDLCDGLIESQIGIKWVCIIYPWLIKADLVEKMAKAGCQDVSLGFESGSEKILEIMNKRFSLDEVREIFTLFKNHGIRQNGFLLLGGPGETRETVLESLEFADSLQLNMTKVTMGIRIYQGTELARTAIEEGLIKSDDDLLQPKFYMVPGLEEWLRTTVEDWVKDRKNWVL